MTGDYSTRPRTTLLSFPKHYISSSVLRFRKLSLSGKLLIFAVVLFYCALVALIVVIKPTHIAQAFYDLGQRIREHPLGWMFLATLIQIISIPPMIGHTTMLNLCGFTYGMKGILVAAPASLIASTLVFITLRHFFGDVLRSLSEKNQTWKALEAVVDAKGLPLIILVRLSPFLPWVYSNSLFASIQSVTVWEFMVATVCCFPKFFLYVFIGARMAPLSDGKQREHMDTQTKVVNIILIVVGIISTFASGWILYALVKRQMEDVSLKTHGLASEDLEESDEDSSLLGNSSSES